MLPDSFDGLVKGKVLFGKNLVVVFGSFKLSIHTLDSDFFLFNFVFDCLELRIQIEISFFTFEKLSPHVFKLFFKIFDISIGQLTDFLNCFFASSQFFS